ncbi:hypothetical protein ACFR99_19205 [Haloarchaeobius amylolyticus]|uniref:Uncharacterized protein n=1 Tax=Haloarchaeobius amylolyticus TaxID=1198296 RepID=A0ABD6BL30_9EURY
MISWFVKLGILAVLFQVVVIAGFYGYLRWRHPVPHAESRPRTKRLLLGGVVLITFGQLAAFGAIGSTRMASLFSLRQAIRIQNAGLLVTFIGYGILVVGFALYLRKRA